MAPDKMSMTNRIRRWVVFGLLLGLSLAVPMAQAAETVTYYYTNQQGTPLATADASGNIVSTSDYRPYGTQVMGSPEAGPGYTGHVNDPDSGLVYMQARYYDAVVGRFLSADANDVEAGAIFSLSRYTYVSDNPVMRIDPDGRQDVLQYKANVPAATGPLERMLSCTQQCSGQHITVTSTNEPIPQHPDDTPHSRGEAADLRVDPGTENEVLQCAANCGAGFGQNERTHPSAHATAPHVHVQIVPGRRGGRGDLPPPQQNHPQPQPQPQQQPQPPPPPPQQPADPQHPLP
jgi:RHS repeat-associated protein